VRVSKKRYLIKCVYSIHRETGSRRYIIEEERGIFVGAEEGAKSEGLLEGET
jgi:hypothetical protein